VDVRRQLVDALRLDMIGPENGSDLEGEVLPQAPSRWYLTGFLVPLEAGEAQKSDETAQDEFDFAASNGVAADDDVTPEPPAARRAFFPSSIGLSLLVPEATRQLKVEASWGDYRGEPLNAPEDGEEMPAPEAGVRIPLRWRRSPRRVEMALALPPETARTVEHEVPGSEGLRLAVSVGPIQALGIAEGIVPEGTRSVFVFLVNHRTPGADELRDERFIFQAGLTVQSAEPLIPRPNLKGHATEEWDERVADLQYRDAYEYSVGHGISTRAEVGADGALLHPAPFAVPPPDHGRRPRMRLPGQLDPGADLRRSVRRRHPALHRDARCRGDDGRTRRCRPPIAKHLKAAIDLGRLCSNDPVCAQHLPENQHECRFLHGAACHGCLLIAETSCEQHNDFLDRALVISTVDVNGAEFFG
jgi:hypothetical protein